MTEELLLGACAENLTLPEPETAGSLKSIASLSVTGEQALQVRQLPGRAPESTHWCQLFEKRPPARGNTRASLPFFPGISRRRNHHGRESRESFRAHSPACLRRKLTAHRSPLRRRAECRPACARAREAWGRYKNPYIRQRFAQPALRISGESRATAANRPGLRPRREAVQRLPSVRRLRIR